MVARQWRAATTSGVDVSGSGCAYAPQKRGREVETAYIPKMCLLLPSFSLVFTGTDRTGLRSPGTLTLTPHLSFFFEREHRQRTHGNE